ncbi:MAG: carboxypeptidase regulatory-like domain-containing protein, partial [Deltaproteobacteria bacterium]|nr:carboxypeptidase regulatory-like domain-containing protein [Deltaproteobacteria bacterium]
MPLKLPFLVAALLITSAACTFKLAKEGPPPVIGVGTGGVGVDGTGGTAGAMVIERLVDGGSTAICKNLQCLQTSCRGTGCMVPPCTGGATTTISGTVYEPGGKVPLYNAIVYVPNAPLAMVKEGVSCDLCDTALSGSPLTQATTDSNGRFRLDNMPAGTDIPLVVQIGRWRRETKIPMVAACADTPLTDVNLTRLPRNQSEGHIPKIALTTGGADALECLLRKIGIDDAEFTPEAGTGRINLFAGGTHLGMPINGGNNSSAGTNRYDAALNGGAMFTDSETWWESSDNLNKYDIILHSCEGTTPQVTTNKSAAAVAAMKAYADAGGRMFASHWHNYWLQRGPQPWPMVARFGNRTDPMGVFTSTIDVSFPKGQALSEWLVNVGASPMPGQLAIRGAKLTVEALLGTSQRWIYNMVPTSVQYFSFGAPVEMPTAQCGKVVFSDLHVS